MGNEKQVNKKLKVFRFRVWLMTQITDNEFSQLKAYLRTICGSKPVPKTIELHETRQKHIEEESRAQIAIKL